MVGMTLMHPLSTNVLNYVVNKKPANADSLSFWQRPVFIIDKNATIKPGQFTQKPPSTHHERKRAGLAVSDAACANTNTGKTGSKNQYQHAPITKNRAP